MCSWLTTLPRMLQNVCDLQMSFCKLKTISLGFRFHWLNPRWVRVAGTKPIEILSPLLQLQQRSLALPVLNIKFQYETFIPFSLQLLSSQMAFHLFVTWGGQAHLYTKCTCVSLHTSGCSSHSAWYFLTTSWGSRKVDLLQHTKSLWLNVLLKGSYVIKPYVIKKKNPTRHYVSSFQKIIMTQC